MSRGFLRRGVSELSHHAQGGLHGFLLTFPKNRGVVPTDSAFVLKPCELILDLLLNVIKLPQVMFDPFTLEVLLDIGEGFPGF